MQQTKPKRGRPTNKEIIKRRRASIKSYLSFLIEDWNATYQIGDFISHKYLKKCFGMILTKPKRMTQQERVKVTVLWYIYEGENTNIVDEISVTALKKFRPWPGLYGTKKKVEEST